MCYMQLDNLQLPPSQSQILPIATCSVLKLLEYIISILFDSNCLTKSSHNIGMIVNCKPSSSLCRLTDYIPIAQVLTIPSFIAFVLEMPADP